MVSSSRDVEDGLGILGILGLGDSHAIAIGSMYGIYANIGGILMVNVCKC